MATVNAITNQRSVWPIAGSLLAPLFAISFYLLVSRWPIRIFSTKSDNIASAVCIAIGLVFVISLPIRFWFKALIVVVYVPLIYALIFFFSLLFVGAAFGDWL